MNFITDESRETGKAANAVVSVLHCFLGNHGLGEEDIYLHADDCAGQNKNNLMVQYLMRRIPTGRQSIVQCFFLVLGHTKFVPGWSFRQFQCLFNAQRLLHC